MGRAGGWLSHHSGSLIDQSQKRPAVDSDHVMQIWAMAHGNINGDEDNIVSRNQETTDYVSCSVCKPRSFRWNVALLLSMKAR
jgi:hypothetical protein